MSILGITLQPQLTYWEMLLRCIFKPNVGQEFLMPEMFLDKLIWQMGLRPKDNLELESLKSTIPPCPILVDNKQSTAMHKLLFFPISLHGVMIKFKCFIFKDKKVNNLFLYTPHPNPLSSPSQYNTCQKMDQCLFLCFKTLFDSFLLWFGNKR